MKTPAKILIIKNQAQENRARALIADETALYWSSSEARKELAGMLRDERFNLIIVDFRDAKANALDFVESVRKAQPEAQVFLLCKELELQEVIRAIRLGVVDVFHPPLDFKSLAERVESLVRNGDRFPKDHGPSAIGRWGELALFLAEALPSNVPPAAGAKGGGRNGQPPAAANAPKATIPTERLNLHIAWSLRLHR